MKRESRRSKVETPSFREEEALLAQGIRFIAGIDEAGRGALAGPVVAAAVILPRGLNTDWLREVRDSKQLSPARRETLYDRIRDGAVATAVGLVSAPEIDRTGILNATRTAMIQAMEALSPAPESLLIDYVHLPGIDLPQKGITRGDALSYSIACASIIAKVTRDRMMVELDGEHKGYGLARHKGYGTRLHLDCLARLGPSPIHRRTFRPVLQYSLFSMPLPGRSLTPEER